MRRVAARSVLRLVGMRAVLVVVGGVLVALSTADAVWTTLAASHGGPITRRLATWVWKIALRLPFHRRRRQVLRLIGAAVPLLTVLTWVTTLWLGWTMIFHGSGHAVVGARDGTPASVPARIYFTGYVLSTMGNGDFVPGSALWQVLTPVAGLHGLVMVTLGVTYLIPLAGADIDKRAIAVVVGALGSRPDDIVLRAWNGHDFGFLAGMLPPLARDLAVHAERHLAYPVLHYLHAGEAARASAVGIARLDEALALLTFAVATDVRPELGALELTRASVAHYIATLVDVVPARQHEVPPLPSLASLRAHGVPLVDEPSFRRAMENEADRRRRLRLLVVNEGWTWEHVLGTAGR